MKKLLSIFILIFVGFNVNADIDCRISNKHLANLIIQLPNTLVSFNILWDSYSEAISLPSNFKHLDIKDFRHEKDGYIYTIGNYNSRCANPNQPCSSNSNIHIESYSICRSSVNTAPPKLSCPTGWILEGSNCIHRVAPKIVDNRVYTWSCTGSAATETNLAGDSVNCSIVEKPANPTNPPSTDCPGNQPPGREYCMCGKWVTYLEYVDHDNCI